MSYSISFSDNGHFNLLYSIEGSSKMCITPTKPTSSKKKKKKRKMKKKRMKKEILLEIIDGLTGFFCD
jgi:hypothetical protein